jgi:hypothetical protein
MRGRGRDRPGRVSIDGIKVVVYGVDAGLLVGWDGMGWEEVVVGGGEG